MSVKSIVCKLLVLAVACLAMVAVGCNGGKGSAKTANVKAGTMPADATWTGVYYNPLYGWLHVVEQGDLVHGKWTRPRKDRWGELHGKADGNLLRFDWTEHEIGVVGPRSKKKGKGYFVYTRPEGDNTDDRIDGEIGTGQDEVGLPPWDGVKQRNQKPDLESIGGSGTIDVGGGDWDESSSEEGEPEPPAEPPDEADETEEKSDGLDAEI
jgi:hypothetical protein